ncbi:transposase [Paracoccus bogoriensis]|nr:transposase [Paracoccus bogoriensis]
MADRGGFAQAVMAAIEAFGATAHIPARATSRWPEPVDRTIYRERNRIERFFNKLKPFCGIAARCFKTAANVLAALHLACARLWIKAHESTT